MFCCVMYPTWPCCVEVYLELPVFYHCIILMFSFYSPQTNMFEFQPDLFMEPLKQRLQFQENVIHTQLFVSFMDKKRVEYINRAGVRWAFECSLCAAFCVYLSYSFTQIGSSFRTGFTFNSTNTRREKPRNLVQCGTSEVC
jgi:hypothetical protein